MTQLPNRPYAVRKTGAAFYIALDKVNADPTLLPGHTLVFEQYLTWCWSADTVGHIVDKKMVNSYIAFIGPGCSEEATHVGQLASYWNISYICDICSDLGFLDKVWNYATMIRLFGPFAKLGGFGVAIADKFGWSRIGLIVDSFGLLRQPAEGLEYQFGNRNMTIIYKEYNSMHDPEYESTFIDVLKAVAQKSRSKYTKRN
ncbi:atrial natriuretic peptide receptor 1-like [Glandiceps talaboti]